MYFEKSFGYYLCDGECEEGVCKVVKSVIVSGGGGGGSSSSSSSGSSITVITGNILDIGELDSDRMVEIKKNEGVRFSVDGNEHTMTLSDNIPTEAYINIDNSPEITLIVGEEEKEFDLDDDGSIDFSVKLKSINIITHKVKLILKNI